MAIQTHISELITAALTDKGLAAVEITGETLLWGGPLGIDSLDLASLVVQLNERTGQDPFANGFIEFRTVGDLAQLYES